MSDLIIREPLASRIREIARRENRAPEEIVAERFSEELWDAIDNPPPRPRESLTDDDIEVPDFMQDKEAYRKAARAIRPKLYRIARRYWEKVGDHEKLALTDEQLDKTFWLIDHEGIPRFKSEKGTIQLPHDPMEDIIGTLDTELTDLSTTVRESVAEYYRKKYGDSD
mgnify:CR=1 FL=1